MVKEPCPGAKDGKARETWEKKYRKLNERVLVARVPPNPSRARAGEVVHAIYPAVHNHRVYSQLYNMGERQLRYQTMAFRRLLGGKEVQDSSGEDDSEAGEQSQPAASSTTPAVEQQATQPPPVLPLRVREARSARTF